MTDPKFNLPDRLDWLRDNGMMPFRIDRAVTLFEAVRLAERLPIVTGDGNIAPHGYALHPGMGAGPIVRLGRPVSASNGAMAEADSTAQVGGIWNTRGGPLLRLWMRVRPRVSPLLRAAHADIVQLEPVALLPLDAPESCIKAEVLPRGFRAAKWATPWYIVRIEDVDKNA